MKFMLWLLKRAAVGIGNLILLPFLVLLFPVAVISMLLNDLYEEYKLEKNLEKKL